MLIYGPFINNTFDNYEVFTASQFSQLSDSQLNTYKFVLDTNVMNWYLTNTAYACGSNYTTTCGATYTQTLDIYIPYLTKGGSLFLYGGVPQTYIDFIKNLGGGTITIRDGTSSDNNDSLQYDSSRGFQNGYTNSLVLKNQMVYGNYIANRRINNFGNGIKLFTASNIAAIWPKGNLTNAPNGTIVLYCESIPFTANQGANTPESLAFANNMMWVLQNK